MSISRTKNLKTTFIAAAMAISIIFAGSLSSSNVISSAFAQQPQLFTANLTGGSEVPPVPSKAVGGVEFQFNGSKMSYIIAVEDPGSFNKTGTHIHQGKIGENGPIVAYLTLIFCYDFCGVPMYIGQGTLDTNSLQGPLKGKPLSSLVDLIKTGEAYVNVHTVGHPDGEIRGQISQ